MQLLGAIAATSGASVNNTNTGTPFTIPPFWPRVLIVTPAAVASGVYYVTVSTGSGLAATTSDFSVYPATSTQIECPRGFSVNTVVAIRGAGGESGNVQVYGLWGQAQS